MPPIRHHNNDPSVEQLWALFDEMRNGPKPDAKKKMADACDYYHNVICEGCGGRNTSVEDYREGCLVCCRCGMVANNYICIPEAPNVPPTFKGRVSARSAPYWPPYHANERIAAWYCMGPRVPDEALAKIRRYIEVTPIVKFTPTGFSVDPKSLRRLETIELNSFHFRQICTSLKLSEYSERWISLKQDLLGGPRVWRPRYPTVVQMLAFHRDFTLLVRSFNRVLYKKGKKHTTRDSVWRSEHPLARHNLPHYNEIFHYLFQMQDDYLRQWIDADTFFPRVKTPTVQKKLKQMLRILFDDLGWDLPDLD